LLAASTACAAGLYHKTTYDPPNQSARTASPLDVKHWLAPAALDVKHWLAPAALAAHWALAALTESNSAPCFREAGRWSPGAGHRGASV
jgi:hypothetical protein